MSSDPANTLSPLDIPELLEIVITYLPFCHAYRCIFVCRAWADIATRDIWGRGPVDFHDVLRLLGPLIYRPEDQRAFNCDYELAESAWEITTSRWARFYKHARLVQHLKFSRTLHPLLENFQILKILMGFHGGEIFRRVRHLTIMSEASLSALTGSWTFLMSGADVRSIRFHYSVVHAAHPLLDLMTRRCAGLQSISTIVGPRWSTRNVEMISSVQYHRWSELSSFRMREIPLQADTLSAISRCPKLHALDIRISESGDNMQRESFSDFNALKDLNIILGHLDEGSIQCFVHFATPSLRRMKLQVTRRGLEQGAVEHSTLLILKLLKLFACGSPHLEEIDLKLDEGLTPCKQALRDLPQFGPQLRHFNIGLGYYGSNYVEELANILVYMLSPLTKVRFMTGPDSLAYRYDALRKESDGGHSLVNEPPPRQIC